MARAILLALLLFVVASMVPLMGPANSYAAEPLKVSDVHLQLAQRHSEAGHPFWAIKSYRRAIASGADNPNSHSKLAQVLYSVGFVDQAIAEMELALKKAPDVDFLHMKMGIFSLASGQLQRALTQFQHVLRLNSGFSYGYYYLGEVYYRLGDYDHAAAAMVFAHKLGLPGFDLQRKLKDIGWRLPRHPWHDDNRRYCLRQIVLDSRTDAEDVQQRLNDGELFEELAHRFSTGTAAANGGYIGEMALASMPKELAAKIANLPVFSAPLLLESTGKYVIVQRIAPYDPLLWQPKETRREARAVETTIVKSQPVCSLSRSATTVVTPPAKNTRNYVLLGGVYHKRKYADERMQQLAAIGIKGSTLHQRGSGDHLRYEVIVGSFAHYKAADAVGRKIKDSGLDFYIRKQK